MSGTELGTEDRGRDRQAPAPYTFHSKHVERGNSYVAFQEMRNAMKNDSRCYNSR